MTLDVELLWALGMLGILLWTLIEIASDKVWSNHNHDD